MPLTFQAFREVLNLDSELWSFWNTGTATLRGIFRLPKLGKISDWWNSFKLPQVDALSSREAIANFWASRNPRELFISNDGEPTVWLLIAVLVVFTSIRLIIGRKHNEPESPKRSNPTTDISGCLPDIAPTDESTPKAFDPIPACTNLIRTESKCVTAFTDEELTTSASKCSNNSKIQDESILEDSFERPTIYDYYSDSSQVQPAHYQSWLLSDESTCQLNQSSASALNFSESTGTSLDSSDLTASATGSSEVSFSTSDTSGTSLTTSEESSQTSSTHLDVSQISTESESGSCSSASEGSSGTSLASDDVSDTSLTGNEKALEDVESKVGDIVAAMNDSTMDKTEKLNKSAFRATNCTDDDECSFMKHPYVPSMAVKVPIEFIYQLY